MLKEILKSIDLTEKESLVYLVTLRIGATKISIIAKRAQLSRSTTYNVLNSLYKKGFVKRYNKGQIQYFSPISPNEIIEILNNKKENLSNKIEMFNTYLPQFEAISNPKISIPKVYFYEGIDGIKKIYEDILKKGNKKTFSALSLDNMAIELKNWLMKSFTKKKVKKNIFSKVLLSSGKAKKYKKLDKKQKRESIVIPYKKHPFEVEIDIYDENKTAFISFDETEMIGVIIESEKIANTMNSLFSLVWEKQKKD